jgi:hypothetical protein
MRGVMASFSLVFSAFVAVAEVPSTNPPATAPLPGAPRAFITSANRAQFRQYCLSGGGRRFFNRLHTEFDEKFMSAPFPEEPPNLGDMDPSRRDSEKAEKWRSAQIAANEVSGIAEAAAVIWIVTGDDRYLNRAREALFAACQWQPTGNTGIQYDEEAHFRLWRRLPFVYDQIRDHFAPAERAAVLDSFRKRGDASYAVVAPAIARIARNSVPDETAGAVVRLVAITGIAGLALYDDLPEAREWLERARDFYARQFTPWGGADGGWAEGPAFWGANLEHGRFQDALLLAGQPDAWSNPFWRQTGYFPLYFVPTAFPATVFGDTPAPGTLRLEPQTADFLRRLARQFDDGYLRSYADECDRHGILQQGLDITRTQYQSGMECLVRNFAGSRERLPARQPLAELPQSRWFRDVGWVSMHSALGSPADDIMLSFKSSPYGSLSHSHADQNAFILSAYGEPLAINAGYREFAYSPHHLGYTRQTLSKNDVLIGGHGQLAQSEKARGQITRFESRPRWVLATGDATEAYNAGTDDPIVERATRDVLFVDHRYFVLRDVIRLERPEAISWLLHAAQAIQWDARKSQALIRSGQACLFVALLPAANQVRGAVTADFPIPVDPKYVAQGYTNQSHLAATTVTPTADQTIYAVLWPSRDTSEPAAFGVARDKQGRVLVTRPDGVRDEISLDDQAADVVSAPPDGD